MKIMIMLYLVLMIMESVETNLKINSYEFVIIKFRR